MACGSHDLLFLLYSEAAAESAEELFFGLGAKLALTEEAEHCEKISPEAVVVVVDVMQASCD